MTRFVGNKSKDAKERLMSSNIINQEFQNEKSKIFLIHKLLEDFNQACSECIIGSKEYDFLNIFEIMKRLGFIRQKENISQTEINSDKALFMDFWQNLDRYKQDNIERDLLLSFCLAIEGFSINDIFKSKDLTKLYHQKSIEPNWVIEEDKNDEDDYKVLKIGTQMFTEPVSYFNDSLIAPFHQVFLQFARNRSYHLKLYKRNKYKQRDNYDNQIREKPSLGKNSINIAKRLRDKYLGSRKTLSYCEMRKQSIDKKKTLSTDDKLKYKQSHLHKKQLK